MATRTRTQFSLAVEMQKALDQILAQQAKDRKAMEAKGDTKDRWYARLCYTTGTDLEDRVRENLDAGRYARIRISGLNGIPLLQHCRDFLLKHPSLKGHNFGRGHISGMRFRPIGLALSDSENRTIAAAKKEKPMHYCEGYKAIGDYAPLCSIETRLKPKKHRGYSSGRNQSKTRVTAEIDNVTCPRCLKAIAAGKHEASRPVKITESESSHTDYETKEIIKSVTFHVQDVATEAKLFSRYAAVSKPGDVRTAKTLVSDWIDSNRVTLEE